MKRREVLPAGSPMAKPQNPTNHQRIASAAGLLHTCLFVLLHLFLICNNVVSSQLRVQTAAVAENFSSSSKKEQDLEHSRLSAVEMGHCWSARRRLARNT